VIELIIGTVSWLATLGFIAAIVADAFRWTPAGRHRAWKDHAGINPIL